MSEIIVAERSEILKSKKGKTYFTVKDTEGNTYVCYHPNQHPDFEPHSNPGVKISPSSNPDYSPSIELDKGQATKNPTFTPQKQSYGRDEDKVDIRTALMCASEQMAAWISVGKMKEINADTPAKLADQTMEVAKRLYINWLISTDKIVEKIVEEIEKP